MAEVGSAGTGWAVAGSEAGAREERAREEGDLAVVGWGVAEKVEGG